VEAKKHDAFVDLVILELKRDINARKHLLFLLNFDSEPIGMAIIVRIRFLNVCPITVATTPIEGEIVIVWELYFLFVQAPMLVQSKSWVGNNQPDIVRFVWAIRNASQSTAYKLNKRRHRRKPSENATNG
jgi:hypothetical protein